MKILFFGTPEASTLVLEKLVANGHTPIAIITNPDRPTGRKQVMTPPPVKQFVTDRGLATKVLQPEKVSDIREELIDLKPELAIVAFYNKLIPGNILSIPTHGTIGVHPSLLPLHRGPSPVQTAILEAAPEVGMTLYLMDEKMDEGPIVAQEKLSSYGVGEQSNIPLWHELATLGGDMLVRVLPQFVNGTIIPRPQDHSLATYTKKFTTDDAFVSESDLKSAQSGTDPELAQQIHQKILAFTPEPGVWTLENGKRVKLLSSIVKDGALTLTLIQREGKKPENP